MSDKAAPAISLIPAEMHHALTVAHAEVARLRLTDAEREALESAIWDYEQNDDDEGCASMVATLRGLLDRHAKGGEP